MGCSFQVEPLGFHISARFPPELLPAPTIVPDPFMLRATLIVYVVICLVLMFKLHSMLGNVFILYWDKRKKGVDEKKK